MHNRWCINPLMFKPPWVFLINLFIYLFLFFIFFFFSLSSRFLSLNIRSMICCLWRDSKTTFSPERSFQFCHWQMEFLFFLRARARERERESIEKRRAKFRVVNIAFFLFDKQERLLFPIIEINVKWSNISNLYLAFWENY